MTIRVVRPNLFSPVKQSVKDKFFWIIIPSPSFARVETFNTHSNVSSRTWSWSDKAWPQVQNVVLLAFYICYVLLQAKKQIDTNTVPSSGFTFKKRYSHNRRQNCWLVTTQNAKLCCGKPISSPLPLLSLLLPLSLPPPTAPMHNASLFIMILKRWTKERGFIFNFVSYNVPKSSGRASVKKY